MAASGSFIDFLETKGNLEGRREANRLVASHPASVLSLQTQALNTFGESIPRPSGPVLVGLCIHQFSGEQLSLRRACSALNRSNRKAKMVEKQKALQFKASNSDLQGWPRKTQAQAPLNGFYVMNGNPHSSLHCQGFESRSGGDKSVGYISSGIGGKVLRQDELQRFPGGAGSSNNGRIGDSRGVWSAAGHAPMASLTFTQGFGGYQDANRLLGNKFSGHFPLSSGNNTARECVTHSFMEAASPAKPSMSGPPSKKDLSFDLSLSSSQLRRQSRSSKRCPEFRSQGKLFSVPSITEEIRSFEIERRNSIAGVPSQNLQKTTENFCKSVDQCKPAFGKDSLNLANSSDEGLHRRNADHGDCKKDELCFALSLVACDNKIEGLCESLKCDDENRNPDLRYVERPKQGTNFPCYSAEEKIVVAAARQLQINPNDREIVECDGFHEKDAGILNLNETGPDSEKENNKDVSDALQLQFTVSCIESSQRDNFEPKIPESKQVCTSETQGKPNYKPDTSSHGLCETSEEEDQTSDTEGTRFVQRLESKYSGPLGMLVDAVHAASCSQASGSKSECTSDPENCKYFGSNSTLHTPNQEMSTVGRRIVRRCAKKGKTTARNLTFYKKLLGTVGSCMMQEKEKANETLPENSDSSDSRKSVSSSEDDIGGMLMTNSASHVAPPLICSKRGRSRALPSRFNDSVLGSWKRETRQKI